MIQPADKSFSFVESYISTHKTLSGLFKSTNKFIMWLKWSQQAWPKNYELQNSQGSKRAYVMKWFISYTCSKKKILSNLRSQITIWPHFRTSMVTFSKLEASNQSTNRWVTSQRLNSSFIYRIWSDHPVQFPADLEDKNSALPSHVSLVCLV